MRTHEEQSDKVLILRPGRLRGLFVVAASVVAIAGLWSIRDQAGRPTVWVAMMLFGGLALFAGVLPLIPGASYLRLDPTGFTYAAAFVPVRVAWRDVAEFGVVAKDAAHAFATVGFNFVPGYTKNAAGRELVRSVNGWESALPTTYGRRAEDLADLMNEWLDRAHDSV